MHDLDRIQAEFADDTFDDDQFFEGEAGFEDDRANEFDEDEFDDEFDENEEPEGLFDEDAPLGEEEEIDLASQLLAASDAEQLEQAVRRIVRPRPLNPRRRDRRRAAGGGLDQVSGEHRRRRRRRRRGFLGRALKGLAKKALPVVGGALGSAVPGVGTAAGAALASGVGKAFGLELEGLSPEDQEMEVARRIVRLGAEAADETDLIDPSVDDETAAKVGMIRAAGKHAPGVMPRADAMGGRPQGPGRPGADRARTAGGPAQSGRWVRRGNRIILLDL